MNVYIAEKIKNGLCTPTGNQTSVWCGGHFLQMKPQKSLLHRNSIKHKWDARKQRRLLVEKIESSKTLSNPKKL